MIYMMWYIIYKSNAIFHKEKKDLMHIFRFVVTFERERIFELKHPHQIEHVFAFQHPLVFIPQCEYALVFILQYQSFKIHFEKI